MRPTALAVVLLVGLCGCDRSTGSGKPDPGSPKGAAVAFATAMEKGDKAGVRAAATGTPEQIEVYEAMAGMYGELGKMLAAADAKYGPDNRLRKELAFLNPQKPAEFEAYEYKVEGDTASVVSNGQASPTPDDRLLKRVNGEWRVDLGVSDPKLLIILMVKSTKGAELFTEMTAGIARGDYPTADAATEALMAKMEAAGKKD